MKGRKFYKKINIFGHDYKVYIVPNLPGNQVGETIHPKRVINLEASLKGENLFLILLHEIRHAAQYESGLTQVLGSQMQEAECEQFASLVSSLKKQGVL